MVTRLILPALSVVLISACGGAANAPPASPSPTKAVLSASIIPNPLTAVATTTSPGYDISYQVAFRETAGVGATMSVLRILINDAAGQFVWQRSFKGGPTYPVTAGGSVTISNEPLITSAHFVPRAGAPDGTVSLSYSVTDALGNVFEGTTSAEIK
jgi:hypothetical protein